MAKASNTTLVVIAEERQLSLGEVCECCDLAVDQLLDLVSEGLLEPQGREPRSWRFSTNDIIRLRTALRLQRDLDLNLAGAVLALQLLDEVQSLRARVRLLEQLLR